MGEYTISNADTGSLATAVTDYSVDAETTDGAEDIEWTNSNWSQQLGYYKKIPELRNAVDALARWTIGKGFTSNEITMMTLGSIKGNGKDTFNSILKNLKRVCDTGGDSFAEIIRDEDGFLINLKPLDPSIVTIVGNSKGLIKGYKVRHKKGDTEKLFKPEEIFHLSRERIADEIHGISLIDAVIDVILMRNEAMADEKILMHRHVKPIFIHHLDTDNAAEIAIYKAKADRAHAEGENIYVPKGSVEIELSAVPANATLNPLPWIDRLNSYFYQITGVPQIIVGGSQEMTEATAKIVYLAWEQTVEEEQLYLEEQVLAQLNLEIELEFPASLKNEILASQEKSETMQASTPEDTSVTNMESQNGTKV